MNIWPWTNVGKMLQTRIKESEDPKNLVTMTVDDLMNHIKENIKNTPWYMKIYNHIKFNIYDLTWYIYRIFKPCHTKIRAAIPRNWTDQVELIRDINFAFIREYVEDEMQSTCWDEGEYKNVHTFLNESYQYITVDRLNLVKSISNALITTQQDPARKHLTYAEKYDIVNKLEEELDAHDMDVLVKLMQYRKYMWS